MIDLDRIHQRATALIASLRGFRHGRLTVADWRLRYGESRRLTIGLHDGRIGSVYSPLQLRDEAGGDFLVAWSDGKVSRGSFDGNVTGDLRGHLEEAAAARIRDDDARRFARPAVPAPATPLHHASVERIVAGRLEPLSDTVEMIRAAGRKARARKVTGSARASLSGVAVRTSRGLDYLGRSTETSWSLGLDGELWDGRANRRAPSAAAIGRAIDALAALAPVARRRAAGVQSGRYPVVAMPRLAEELLDTYLIGNLQGAAVASGRSAFTIADFRRHRPVLRDDLQLAVDPTVPLAAGSYHLTGDGVAARPTVYIDRGRLRRPIVDFKYASRLGVRPTTPPRSMDSVSLTGRTEATTTLARTLAGLDQGLLLTSLLGLHTQDASSGDLSLTAPRAILYRGGEPRGGVKAVIAGNFFEQLRAPGTRLIAVPGDRFPALLFEVDVTVG